MDVTIRMLMLAKKEKKNANADKRGSEGLRHWS